MNNRRRFIDGDELQTDIIDHMPQLNKFNIRSIIAIK
jgi:hypothetical protein